jgi:RNA recognition motif-containing protein
MTEQAQAQAAIKSLNGKELMGKQMSVNEARPSSDQKRTGGQGGQMNYGSKRNRY